MKVPSSKPSPPGSERTNLESRKSSPLAPGSSVLASTSGTRPNAKPRAASGSSRSPRRHPTRPRWQANRIATGISAPRKIISAIPA